MSISTILILFVITAFVLLCRSVYITLFRDKLEISKVVNDARQRASTRSVYNKPLTGDDSYKVGMDLSLAMAATEVIERDTLAGDLFSTDGCGGGCSGCSCSDRKCNT